MSGCGVPCWVAKCFKLGTNKQVDTVRLPLTIVGGFLGAGKTTLIQRLLRQAGGRRIAVLVNDFGKLNIDARLIAQAGADTIELTNGCVCCSIGDDLNGALIQLEARASEFDHVVIEASGVSDPWKIAQIGLLNAGYRLDGVVVVVDASTVLELLDNPRYDDTLLRQCRHADLLLLNQIDLVPGDQAQIEAHTQTIRRRLVKEKAHTQVICCTEADIPTDVLLSACHEVSRKLPSVPRWGDDLTSSGHPQWQTLSFCSDRVWTRASFEACLSAVPVQLIRGKAILRQSPANPSASVSWIEWHRVCGRDTWIEHIGPPPVDRSLLVLIGLDVLTDTNKTALQTHLWY